MKCEKRFFVHIKKSLSGFFTVKGIKIRTPAKFVASESEIPLIEVRMRLESVTDYEITPVENENKNATITVK